MSSQKITMVKCSGLREEPLVLSKANLEGEKAVEAIRKKEGRQGQELSRL